MTYRYVANTGRPPPIPIKMYRDEAVQTWHIKVVQEDGSLSSLVRKDAVLKDMNRATHWLQQGESSIPFYGTAA